MPDGVGAVSTAYLNSIGCKGGYGLGVGSGVGVK